jgi:hypothetical protein
MAPCSQFCFFAHSLKELRCPASERATPPSPLDRGDTATAAAHDIGSATGYLAAAHTEGFPGTDQVSRSPKPYNLNVRVNF